MVFAPFFSCGMAAALEKHILASQKFLGTVRHLPSFAEARDKQAENVLKKMSKSPLHVEQAAALVERLDSSIWGSHVDALKSAVVLEDALEKEYTIARLFGSSPLPDHGPVEIFVRRYERCGLGKVV